MSVAGPAQALLDVGTHAVDMARLFVVTLTKVVRAMTAISIKERRLPTQTTPSDITVQLSDEAHPVSNDDVVSRAVEVQIRLPRLAHSQQAVWPSAWEIRFLCWFREQKRAPFDLLLSAPVNIRSANRTAYQFCHCPLIGRYHLMRVRCCQFHIISVAVGYAEAFGFMIHEFLSCVASGKP